MKLLLCINSAADLKEMFGAISAQTSQLVTLPDPQSSHYLFSFHYLQHEIDVCETGYGLFQTTFKVTKTLAQKKYHLALKVSFCNAYKPELAIGDVVNVIKDKPGDAGTSTADGFKDIYDQGLINKEHFPHFKGAFVNMNNSYMNVMLPFKKVVAVTVNQYADAATYEAKKDRYRADVETMDGLGFVYPCMYERQPFYQLACVERNLATGDQDHAKAKAMLNEILFDILQKI